jgi:C-terminal peptidase prc
LTADATISWRTQQQLIKIYISSLLILILVTFFTSLAHSETRAEELDKVYETMWAPTEFGSQYLDNLMSEAYCGHSAQRFLGCVAAAERLAQFVNPHFQFTITNSELKLKPSSNSKSLNFKQSQKLKRSRFIQIQMAFNSKNLAQLMAIYQNLRKKIPNLKPHQVALPVNASLAIIYDPHKQYFPKFKYNGLHHIRQKPGIGVVLSLDSQDQVVVDKVTVHSEAEKLGLRPGDLITHVNGHSLIAQTSSELDKALEFENNQKVELQIERNQKQYSLRATFSYSNQSPIVDRIIETANKKWGYLYMSTIPDNFDPETECRIIGDRILKPMDVNTDGLILDLRHNNGGPGETAACLTGLFIGKDHPVYIDQDYILDSRTVVSTLTQKAYSKPLVVLVNGETKSSGELLAGALQFHNRALLIGDRTYGKSIGQMVESFPNQKVDLYYTISKAYWPDGTSYHARGLVPNIKAFEWSSKPTPRELNVLREEDIAVFPMKLNPIPAIDNFYPAETTAPNICATEKLAQQKMDETKDLSWQKDYTLQMGITQLECQSL